MGYYLEVNEKSPIVSIENEYPFKKINTRKNNDYLFKVTYFENKINIDFFHALTDGNVEALASGIFGITCSSLIYRIKKNREVDIQDVYNGFINTVIEGLTKNK